MTTKVKLIMPPAHLGATANDDLMELIIRALSLKHGEDGSWADKYGADYEDDTILLRRDNQHPDCTCSYEPNEKAWLEANPHSEKCFVTIAGKVVKELEEKHPLPPCKMFYEMDDVDAAQFVQFWHNGPGPTAEQLERQKAKKAAHAAEHEAYSKASKVRREAVTAAICKLAAEHGQLGKDKIEERFADWVWEYRCTCGRSKLHGEWQHSNEHVRPCEIWWCGQPNFMHKPSGLEVRWYKYIGRDMKYNMKTLPPEHWQQIKQLVTEDEIKQVLDNASEAHETFANMIATANAAMQR
ncbi:MAG: hypothetical protein M3O09_18185 [Acidobacteriota bacterium]|nr:hypothetical protein [Acidobacteriota bacterium]